jgi:hypothetical protein
MIVLFYHFYIGKISKKIIFLLNLTINLWRRFGETERFSRLLVEKTIKFDFLKNSSILENLMQTWSYAGWEGFLSGTM